MKIKIKRDYSLVCIFFLIAMEQFMYLININKFNVRGSFNYDILWLFLFILTYLYTSIKYSKIKCNYKFGIDAFAVICLVLIAAYQCFKLTGQPIFIGFRPQRNLFFIMLAYFPIRKLFAINKIDEKVVFKGIFVLGIVQCIIYILQQLTYSKIVFVYSQIGYRYGSVRLYIDSAIIIVMIFIALDKFYSSYRIKYLMVFILGILYELTVSKGRLELISILFSSFFGFMLIKKHSNKKMISIIVILCLGFAFLNSAYVSDYIDAMSTISSTDPSASTMGVRNIARMKFKEQLNENISTYIFGCGYPSELYGPAANKIGYSNNLGLVDNGIFAYKYVYGTLGLICFLLWFGKLGYYSWKIYKKNNEYMPIMYFSFLTLVSYNITFWWWKADWTFILVLFMCYLEHKLFDCNTEKLSLKS